MQQLQAFIGQEIVWEKTALFGNQYQLVANDQVLATLDINGFGSDARAQSAEGSIVIQCRGFFNVTYHMYHANTEFAVYTPNWGGSGTLRFADGRTFKWRSMGIFSGEHAWEDELQRPLIRFKSSFGGGKLYVTIDPAAKSIAELSLLAILGRYLETLNQRKSSAATINATI